MASGVTGATGAGANPMEISESEYWRQAQKLYKNIQREVSGLKRVAPADINDGKWENLEGSQAKLRLLCVSIVFKDFEYAVRNKVDQTLWNSHTQVNSAYRNANKRFPPELRVKKRLLEARYTKYISTSQLFYKGYIQRLSAKFDIEPLHRLASAVHVARGPGDGSMSPVPPELKAMIIIAVQETLTYLGDLSRYRYQIKPNPRDTQSAVTYYSLAHDIQPDNGFPLHQIAITYLESEKHLDVVYYFYLSLARAKPHLNALANLEAKFKTVKDATSFSAGTATPPQILGGRTAQLHAKYMANEPFATREELEKTVLLRLEQHLQYHDPENVALKIALVNMGSYYRAQTFEEPRLYASAYSLAFNVRFLQVICRILCGHIQEAQGSMPGESSGQEQPVSNGMATAIRVLRLYCCWLCSHARDLSQAPVEMHHMIQEMWKEFAKTAGVIVSYFKSSIVDLAGRIGQALPPTAPYLLDEDEEAVDYLALGDAGSEIYARALCKQDSSRKLNIREFDGEKLKPMDEVICRVGDIMASIQHFANNPVYPVVSQSDEVGNFCMEYGYCYNTVPEPQGLPVSQQQETGNSKGVVGESVEAMSNYQRLAPEAKNAARETTTADAEAQACNLRQIVELLESPEMSEAELESKKSQQMDQVTSHCTPLPWDWHFQQPASDLAWVGLTVSEFEKTPNITLPRPNPQPQPQPQPRPQFEKHNQQQPPRRPQSQPQSQPQRSAAGPAGEVDQRQKLLRMLRGGPLAPSAQAAAGEASGQSSGRGQPAQVAQPAQITTNAPHRTLYRPGQSLRGGNYNYAGQSNVVARPQSSYGQLPGRGGHGRGHNRQASYNQPGQSGQHQGQQGQQGQQGYPQGQGPQQHRSGHRHKTSRDSTSGRGGRGGANRGEPEGLSHRSKPWK